MKCSFDKICATAETAKNADSEESIKKVKVLMVSPSSSSMGSDKCESKSEVDQASNKHHEPQQSQYEHQNVAHEWEAVLVTCDGGKWTAKKQDEIFTQHQQSFHERLPLNMPCQASAFKDHDYELAKEIMQGMHDQMKHLMVSGSPKSFVLKFKNANHFFVRFDGVTDHINLLNHMHVPTFQFDDGDVHVCSY